jgi:ketosteroid isomerase-like protein
MSPETMIPTPSERDELFRGFSKAVFKLDLDALYAVVASDFVWSFHDGLSVTRVLVGREAIGDHLLSQKSFLSAQRFEDIGYYHLPEMTLMTCRIDETVRATGELRHQRGVELYTFRDGKISTKDVYRKPIALSE